MVGADIPDPIGMGPSAYQQVGVVLEKALDGVYQYLETRHEDDLSHPDDEIA